MKILLVAATKNEIEPFLNQPDIEVLICGVGMPATVYHLTKKLLNKKYDIVIQAGIAGSFSKKIKKGEVVMVKEDVFGDLGVEENGSFKTIFNLGFGNENNFPFSTGTLKNTLNILETGNFKKVNAVTVNKISDDKKIKKQLKEIFSTDIESMEGAAFHYVCLMQKIPFIQLRSISNKVGERDKKKWKIKKSFNNLNKELLRLIELLNKKAI